MSGVGEYADIATGAKVTVFGAVGAVLVQGTLGKGTALSNNSCVFIANVADVPLGDGPYAWQIAERNKWSITEADLANNQASILYGQNAPATGN